MLQAAGAAAGLGAFGSASANPGRGRGKGRGRDRGNGPDHNPGRRPDETYWPSDRKPAYSIGFTHDVELRNERRNASRVFYEFDWTAAIGKTIVGHFGRGQRRRYRERDDVRYVAKVRRPTLHADPGDCPAFHCCEWTGGTPCCSDGGFAVYPKDDGSSWSGQCTPWGVDRIGAPAAHAAGHTGAGTDIAILDTGIDMDHPDIAGNLSPPHYSGSGDDADDEDGHGTHVAGLAAAPDNGTGTVGVAPDATIHAADVFHSSASTADAIRWAADNDFDVINMSIGFTSCSGDLDDIVPAVQDATIYAYYGYDADSKTEQPNPDKGTFIAASAGNAGNDECSSGCCGYACSCICPPGVYNVVQTVSATGYDSATDQDYLTDFSSCGPQVDIAAPGELVGSAYQPAAPTCDEQTYGGGCGSDAASPYYARISGTSQSSPLVAGAAAVLMGQGFTAEQAKQVLNRTAADIGLTRDEQGAGLLDIGAASGATYTGGLLVVNDQPEVDSTTPAVTYRGQFMGETVSNVTKVGFRHRVRYDGGYTTGSWTVIDLGSPSSAQFNTTVSIESEANGDGCHAYEYQAFAENAAGRDYSRKLAYWSDTCCLNC